MYFRPFLVLMLSLLSVPALAEPVNVLVSIKPIHSLVSGVMEGVARPQLLVAGSQSPHSFSLKPSDIRKVTSADLLVWMGPELETSLERTISANRNGKQVLQLLSLQGLEQGEEEGHGESHHHHGHDHGHHHEEGKDPHIWLSLHNATMIVDKVAELLIKMDAGNAELYQKNRKRLLSRIKALDLKLDNQLKPVRQMPFVVFHDAYGLFVSRYQLKSLGAVAVNPERLPGAKHIAELRKTIMSKKARCVFSEPQFQPKLVRILTENTEAKSGILDPLGATLEAGSESYFQLMQQLADSLVNCLKDPAPQ